MRPTRLGAVGYLNARPLVHGLRDQPSTFTIRYDVPSHCATLLHEGTIDLGMIPAIELLADPDYLVVPGAAIGSDGPVTSVAVYTKRPTEAIRSIALDSSSRTSAALLKILCADRFRIQPTFSTMAPNIDAMLSVCDAALIIGDNALFLDHEAAGLRKIDLGEEWTAMTGLPFVWAFWVGRRGAASPKVVRALNTARADGVLQAEAIARDYVKGDPGHYAVAARYLTRDIKFGLGARELNGLQRYYEAAAELAIVPKCRRPEFFDGTDRS
jgi:chorismate dehydratase